MALSEAAKQISWLRRVLNELRLKQNTTSVHEDNAGTFKGTSGHIAEDFRRSKHVDLRYHHVREQVQAKTNKYSQSSDQGYGRRLPY